MAAALSPLALLAIAACGSAPADARERPVVLTTFTVLADMASNVAGDRLEVHSITKPGAEIHGYQPTPGDLRRAAEADLILDNGLGLEAWFERFVAELDVAHVVVSEGVTPIPIAGDTDDGLANPHAWMSPLSGAIYVDNIIAALTELDPAGRSTYQRNGEAYKQRIAQTHDELMARLAQVPPDQRALVTCEGAFSYLARDAALTEAYIWPVNAEQQATPKQVASVIGFVRDNEVPAVFCESTVSDAPMRQVVRETATRFGGTLYVDSLSRADGPVPSYLDLLRYDADTIADALTGATR